LSTTPSPLFAHLPDGSRLWIFGVARSLTDQEAARVLAQVDEFLLGWKAHGVPLAAAREWLYNRFLLVAVDDRTVPPSGCSIDGLVRGLRKLEEDLETSIVGGAPIWYREGPADSAIRTLSRAEFAKRAEEGLVSGQTVVFDLSLTNVGELRSGKWEGPAADSWHRAYLNRPATAP
jgi:hypothetical protein